MQAELDFCQAQLKATELLHAAIARDIEGHLVRLRAVRSDLDRSIKRVEALLYAIPNLND
jgi:hypothetical protein